MAFVHPMTFLDYAARGKNAWWRYVLGWLVALFFALVICVVLLIPPIVLGWFPSDPAQLQSPKNPVIFFSIIGISFVALLGGFAAVAPLLHGKSPLDLLGSWAWSDVATGVGIWLVVLMVTTGIAYAMRPDGFTVTLQGMTLAGVLVTVVALIIQTFAEEYVFRGYLTQGLWLGTKNIATASLISGLLFGAMHIPNGIPQAIWATVFGIVLSVVAIRTGSIAFGAGLHAINNIFGAVIVVSGEDVFAGAPALLTQTTPDLFWWDVGAGMALLLGVAWLILRLKKA